jgi:hypothetical protein
MFIEKEKIIFIHIPKTGGDSIEFLLEKKYNQPLRYYRHCELCHIIDKTNIKDITEYKIFIVIRNPYERLLSTFYHQFGNSSKQKITEYLKNIICIMKNKEKYIPVNTYSHKKYIETNKLNHHDVGKLYTINNQKIEKSMIEPLDYWIPTKYMNNITFLNFHDLNHSFDKYKEIIGIQDVLPKRNNCKVNKDDKYNIDLFYSDEMKKDIEMIYKKDLEIYNILNI